MPRSRSTKAPRPPAVAIINGAAPVLIPAKLVSVHKFAITVGMRARLDALRQAGSFTTEAEVLRFVLKTGLDALEF